MSDRPESWLENSYHTEDRMCQPMNECMSCGERDCPEGCAEHYWQDGCPADCIAKRNKRYEAAMAPIYEQLRQNPINLSALPPPHK